jgi:hypothetical protein
LQQLLENGPLLWVRLRSQELAEVVDIVPGDKSLHGSDP